MECCWVSFWRLGEDAENDILAIVGSSVTIGSDPRSHLVFAELESSKLDANLSH
jgi:hypothetical protein